MSENRKLDEQNSSKIANRWQGQYGHMDDTIQY